MRAAGQVFRFVSRQPPAPITVDVRGAEPQLLLGPSTLPADLTVTADAETLHRIWLSQERLRDALATGRVQVDGSPLKALNLVSLFRQAEAIYPALLRERGLFSGTTADDSQPTADHE